MIRHHRSRTRSPQYARRWPRALAASSGVATGATAIVGLAYLAGPGRPRTGSRALDVVLQTLSEPAPAIGAAFAAVVLGAWCFRQAWLHRLAWRPGPIEVPAFALGPGVADLDPSPATVIFRQRLAVLRLSAPTPVPGAPSGGDFLDVLERERIDSRNLLGSLVTLMRAAKPRHAWTVTGLLQLRDEAPRHGVTIQVSERADRADPPQTLWSDSWEDAVRIAADHATALILPRTRLCRAPWAAWRRFVMPGELLERFEQGVRLESVRRYDEALDAYYRASALDPMNLPIRLHIGKLQEKLALPLDAMMTYLGMEQVSERAPTRVLPGRGRAGEAQRRRALLASRYRRVVLMGGSEFAEQWCKPGPRKLSAQTARDRRRVELRSRMFDTLEQRLQLTARRHAEGTVAADPARRADPERLRRVGTRTAAELLAGDRRGDDRLFELRELLALAALADLHGLPRTPLRIRERRQVVPRKALRLTKLCIEVRLTWVQHRLRATNGDAAPAWPPTAAALERRIEAIERHGTFSRWQEHYNAACAYALPLMTAPVQDASAEELASRAVDRLARATSCVDSGYMAGRREWLLSEDPDLDGLRAHRRFKAFEAMYFPSPSTTPRRPRHCRDLEAARYVRDIVVMSGDRWAQAWRGRGCALRVPPEPYVLADWLSTDCEAWRLVRAVATDYRHWPVRLQLVQRMEAWSRDHAFQPLAVRFPCYADDPLAEPARGRLPASAAERAAARLETRLAAVRLALPDVPAVQPRPLAIDRRPVKTSHVAALCAGREAMWRALADWLRADLDDGGASAPVAALGAQFAEHERRVAERVRLPRRARASEQVG